MYSVAKDEHTATRFDLYQAVAFAVRDRLMERWFQTQDEYYKQDVKRVYYLSMEFLTGRALGNNILNLGATDAYREALASLGIDLSQLEDEEPDAGLGNGGLGRLAACFLDSAASIGIPFYGYGIRYEYGIFRQHIENGAQLEAPDNWLRYGNPWEIARPDALYPVRFYGHVEPWVDDHGHERLIWTGTENVMAMAYDTPVLGWRNDVVNTLRLWSARSTREFDLESFNVGDYVTSVEDKTASENISKVLYPADDRTAGRELRLKQQYFFVSATIQDVIRRYRKSHGDWSQFADKVAIQLNDTHPTVAIPELMRVFVDDEHFAWDDAWALVQKVFGYTNHTILPEALEKWPEEILGKLLPRHLQIIEEIDRRFRLQVAVHWPDDGDRAERLAILGGQAPQRTVRMAHLAIAGSHSVNGVAELHSEILKTNVFPDFNAIYPGRFNNKTNGITQRRWLMKCNPGLAALITDAIGERWMGDLDGLRDLARFAEDAGFRARWRAVKRERKAALADWLFRHHALRFDPDTLLDCQVKRIHEYKRQLLNVLHAISLAHRIRDGHDAGPSRTILFAGKAAPSYVVAKLVIRLVNAVGDWIRKDPVVSERLHVVFVPDYSVTAAERIFPACELSEQISTAGTEASGTGNMKAALNGALTIGTLDGANVEIREEVGEADIFIFGHTAPEIRAMRASSYDPKAWVTAIPELARVLDTIGGGDLTPDDPGLFLPIVEMLLGEDRYFHCADFAGYLDCHRRAGDAYQRGEDWTRMSIRNVAGSGKFSSDRTISQYAKEIWGAVPAKR
jgi:glycogen phosphorylase